MLTLQAGVGTMARHDMIPVDAYSIWATRYMVEVST